MDALARKSGCALLRVPAKLLAERDGHGVHQVRAADLDDRLTLST